MLLVGVVGDSICLIAESGAIAGAGHFSVEGVFGAPLFSSRVSVTFFLQGEDLTTLGDPSGELRAAEELERRLVIEPSEVVRKSQTFLDWLGLAAAGSSLGRAEPMGWEGGALWLPSTPPGGPPQVHRLGRFSGVSRASPPLLSLSFPAALRRTSASSLSFSLRSSTGKNRFSLTEPSLRRRVPGESHGNAIVAAAAVAAA